LKVSSEAEKKGATIAVKRGIRKFPQQEIPEVKEVISVA
jgi:hypothetical protein